MNHTAETTQIEQLLRDLIATYICEPEAMQIEIKEHPGRVVWTLQVTSADMPLLCGKLGIHSIPLIFLVGEIGKNCDRFFSLRIKDPQPGRSGGKQPVEPAENYDPTPDRQLLERLLEAVGVGEYHIEHLDLGIHPESGRLNNEFVIWLRGADDYALLTVPPIADSPMTIIGALGTLFRAAAARKGIRIHLQVTKVP